LIKLKSSFYAFGVPVIYGFVLRGFFVSDLYSTAVGIVSAAFILFGPVCIGALTIFLSPPGAARNVWYNIFAPWLSIGLFILLTFLVKFEGAICIVMALPIFLVMASAGGLIAGEMRRRRQSKKLSVIAAVLLPFLIIPIEGSFELKPSDYEAFTSTEINAPADVIWQNVVRVREISPAEDNGKLSKFMGFPRPIVAELDTLMLGGRRKAVFDKGLVFDEVVYDYSHERKMSFSITPLTSEIPPATLDEHVIAGGKYFTVLDGTYELEKLSENRYKLILYSHFKLNTTFNFYSGMWSKWIMSDIQNNILCIIKERCEINN
jgi:hypothetical protein